MYLHSAFHELFECLNQCMKSKVDFVCVEKYTLAFLAYNMSVSREKSSKNIERKKRKRFVTKLCYHHHHIMIFVGIVAAVLVSAFHFHFDFLHTQNI